MSDVDVMGSAGLVGHHLGIDAVARRDGVRIAVATDVFPLEEAQLLLVLLRFQR